MSISIYLASVICIFLGSSISLSAEETTQSPDCNHFQYCDKCIPSTCYYPPGCNKPPVTSGHTSALEKRCLGIMPVQSDTSDSMETGTTTTTATTNALDCDHFLYCDRCIPQTCHFDAGCNKPPVTKGGPIGIGKRCLG